MPVMTDARPENEVPIEFVLRRVGDSYFKVLGIPLSLGRVFNSTDEYGKARVAVVNKEAARMFWPSRDPVGGRIRIGDPEDGLPWFQVVGVVDDARESYLELPMLPVIYWSYRQSPSQRVVLLARGKGKGSTLAEELKRQVWHVDPQQPVSRVATVEQLYDRQLAGRKMRAIVFVSYAATAFVLVGLGLYGALSYTVKRRFREVAVRMACGARDRDVVLMFMKMAGGILLAGTVVGCFGAAAFGHVLESLLFEVAWLDGKVMAASIGLVLSWGLVACYPAAAAVTEVQPSAWLRDG
jgi:putative ABC transport system permease protein